MKTKSKRFLNLATLCLALLGTALLMTRPVKAEEVMQAPEAVQQEDAEDREIKKEYMERYGKLEEQYEKNRFQGYLAGYKDGLRGYSRPDLDDLYPPFGYKGDPGDYKDGYDNGFGEGWRKSHPVETFLEIAWYYLTDMFYSLFGDGESSQ
ncbi:hypothetical protein R2618_04145 [Streptococcus pyogenes]|uniref:hypothetical protein n=1 Tax=Streptococcus pyogenes TaxID=1314 RepID=UPI00050CE589|nr:hypothetical protein [Streptococcus pyogenes]HER4615893.1 hypothetical protein [Streptococcus pyogenes NGAS535]KGE55878.1 hypothetical protein SPYAA472_0350 [Streptococcus pyogenes AA472]QCK64824.1 hypothetical protein ETT50_07720 [Streptococcus pyogenes]VGW42369.1 Uncharacterised protein [Streptococcus pyogenes]VGW70259.1 Uncharacterised protein [Streptococcus pyogenes]